MTGTVVACGGDDDDGGGTTADAAPPDAAPAPAETQLLLGLEGSVGGLTAQFQSIVTYVLSDDGTSADFSIQSITDATCVAAADARRPVGDPAVVNGVAIAADGTFEFSLTDAVIPENAHAFPDCTGDLTISVTVNGTLSADGTACGTAMLTAPIPVAGTFGTVAIPTGTVGDALPEAVFGCAP